MTVPAADQLREAHICSDPEGQCRQWIAADLLDAIDASWLREARS